MRVCCNLFWVEQGVTCFPLGSLICRRVGWEPADLGWIGGYQNVFIPPSSKWCHRSQRPIISEGRYFLEPWNFWQGTCSFGVTQRILFPTESTKQCFSRQHLDWISLCRSDLWDLVTLWIIAIWSTLPSPLFSCMFPQMFNSEISSSSWFLCQTIEVCVMFFFTFSKINIGLLLLRIPLVYQLSFSRWQAFPELGNSVRTFIISRKENRQNKFSCKIVNL